MFYYTNLDRYQKDSRFFESDDVLQNQDEASLKAIIDHFNVVVEAFDLADGSKMTKLNFKYHFKK